MRNFLIETLAALTIFGCSSTHSRTIRSIDPNTKMGYEIELIDRNDNGKIDMIKTYLICEGIRSEEPLIEKDILKRRIDISANYHYVSRYYREQKDFKTNITWNYPYKECEILNL